MAEAAPIEGPQDLVRRMPLVAEDIVKEYLPDQQWAHMRPAIVAQVEEAYRASSEDFLLRGPSLTDSEANMMFNYLYFMSPPVVEYISKLIEGPRSAKNPVRLPELRAAVKQGLYPLFEEVDPGEIVETVLASILLAHVYRPLRAKYYAALPRPPLDIDSITFLYDVHEFTVPKLITQEELERTFEKAIRKVYNELGWAQSKVDANRAKVMHQIGKAGVAANQAKVDAIKQGKAGGRRHTRRSHRRRGTRKGKRGGRK